MGGKQYTQEHKNWLKANAPFHTYPELVKMFNDEFGQNRTVNGIERMCRDKLHIKHATAYGYSEVENEWLLENAPNHSCFKLSELMEERFGVLHTPESLKMHCREKLHIHKTQGLQYEYTHQNKVDVGTIVTQGGKRLIKCSDSVNGGKSNFMGVGRYVYEQAFGKLPSRTYVIYLDGDENNIELSNLKAVSQEAHSQLAVNGLFGLGKLTSVAIDCYELDMTCKGFRKE